jgi:hypothetical protein
LSMRIAQAEEELAATPWKDPKVVARYRMAPDSQALRLALINVGDPAFNVSVEDIVLNRFRVKFHVVPEIKPAQSVEVSSFVYKDDVFVGYDIDAVVRHVYTSAEVQSKSSVAAERASMTELELAFNTASWPLVLRYENDRGHAFRSIHRLSCDTSEVVSVIFSRQEVESQDVSEKV